MDTCTLKSETEVEFLEKIDIKIMLIMVLIMQNYQVLYFMLVTIHQINLSVQVTEITVK